MDNIPRTDKPSPLESQPAADAGAAGTATEILQRVGTHAEQNPEEASRPTALAEPVVHPVTPRAPGQGGVNLLEMLRNQPAKDRGLTQEVSPPLTQTGTIPSAGSTGGFTQLLRAMGDDTGPVREPSSVRGDSATAPQAAPAAADTGFTSLLRALDGGETRAAERTADAGLGGQRAEAPGQGTGGFTALMQGFGAGETSVGPRPGAAASSTNLPEVSPPEVPRKDESGPPHAAAEPTAAAGSGTFTQLFQAVGGETKGAASPRFTEVPAAPSRPSGGPGAFTQLLRALDGSAPGSAPQPGGSLDETATYSQLGPELNPATAKSTREADAFSRRTSGVPDTAAGPAWGDTGSATAVHQPNATPAASRESTSYGFGGLGGMSRESFPRTEAEGESLTRILNTVTDVARREEERPPRFAAASTAPSESAFTGLRRQLEDVPAQAPAASPTPAPFAPPPASAWGAPAVPHAPPWAAPVVTGPAIQPRAIQPPAIQPPTIQPPHVSAPALPATPAAPSVAAAPPAGALQQYLPLLLIVIIFLLVVILITMLFLLKR